MSIVHDLLNLCENLSAEGEDILNSLYELMYGSDTTTTEYLHLIYKQYKLDKNSKDSFKYTNDEGVTYILSESNYLLYTVKGSQVTSFIITTSLEDEQYLVAKFEGHRVQIIESEDLVGEIENYINSASADFTSDDFAKNYDRFLKLNK